MGHVGFALLELSDGGCGTSEAPDSLPNVASCGFAERGLRDSVSRTNMSLGSDFIGRFARTVARPPWYWARAMGEKGTLIWINITRPHHPEARRACMHDDEDNAGAALPACARVRPVRPSASEQG